MSRQRQSDCRFTWKTCVGYLCSGCVQFSILLCYGANDEEIEQDQDEEDIGCFVDFRIKSLEGFAILEGGATKTVSGFMSVQPVADQYEGTTIETTGVGFTFGGETEAASTNISMPQTEFPQGTSVNAVSNEPTPFLIGLDVLHEYGLVIDYHYNRVYSHILKRCLCAILPTGHLVLEMMPSNSECGQHPVTSGALSTRHWGLHSRAQEKGTLSFESSTCHLHDEESEHEHERTSTSEDDLLKLVESD